MLQESKRLLVFGTDVLILSTKHKTISSKFEPQKTTLYKKLTEFSPSVLAVELVGRLPFRNKRCSSKSDIEVLIQYARENKSVEVIQYDIEMHKSLLEYGLERTEEQKKAINSSSSGEEYREELYTHHRKMYKDMFEDREVAGMQRIMEHLGDTERLAIHCGRNHYTSYLKFLRFLK
jgi:hypothetical protein